MNTSVGLGANDRPAWMLSALCMRSFRCRISSRGVISRDGGGGGGGGGASSAIVFCGRARGVERKKRLVMN
jgi:hypothetical protein